MQKAKAWLFAALLAPASPLFTRSIDWRNDNPLLLAPEQKMELNLRTLDLRSHRSARSSITPWSDVSWKANKGLIAERLTDPRYQRLNGWKAKRDFLRTYHPRWVLRQPGRDRDDWIASLSPAEKYDLLLGVLEGGLTDQISEFLDRNLAGKKQFPSWWGLCEGAAASSIYYPEPTRAVVLRSEAFGVDIPFYATDIKGLATMLWSRFNTDLRIPESGQQCANTEDTCFDANPASFHASLHHFLDLHPGMLVGEMDPTPVVWNFPIVAYSEQYYRPDRGAARGAKSLAEAALSAGSWRDPRRGKRAPGTAYVVGVRMSVSYGVNQPHHPPFEGSESRKINTRVLDYELELDSSWNMIGGEWVSGSHPDLLWSIPKGSLPNSAGDFLISPSEATPDSMIPKSWSAAAKISAQKMSPLRRVVELLVKKSAKGN